MTWLILYAAAGLLYLEKELRVDGGGLPPGCDPGVASHRWAWYLACLSIYLAWPIWLAGDIIQIARSR